MTNANHQPTPFQYEVWQCYMMQHLSRPGADLADPAGLSLVLRSPGRPGPARPIPSLPFRPVHSRYAFFPARNRQDLYQKRFQPSRETIAETSMFANGKTKQHMRKVSIGSDFLFECFLHGLFFLAGPRGHVRWFGRGVRPT